MKYKKVFPQIFFAILVSIIVLSVQPLSKNDQDFSTKEAARVLRVVDGDTIEVSLSNRRETVRLIGIDSPEIKDERKSAQCFGKEASIKAKEVLTGKAIILESDPTQENRDEYGRLLRYVFLDGANFNKFMIGEGYAYEYTFKNIHYKYQSEFAKAEEKAEENRVGLWRKCHN